MSFNEDLENWIPAIDDESLRKAGTFKHGIHQLLPSPLVREIYLNLLHSGSLEKDYSESFSKFYDSIDKWEKKESNFQQNIEEPTVLNKEFLAAALWRNSLNSFHRVDGKPAKISDGLFEYQEYGMAHRLDGTAYELEYYYDENHTIWNEYVKFNYEKFKGDQNHWYLFGHHLSEFKHKTIVDFHKSSGVPLEVAFLLVGTGQTLSQDMIDLTLPLLWQIQLAKKGLLSSENSFVRSVDNWFKKKKELEQKYQENVAN
jgi:hypothetical protein